MTIFAADRADTGDTEATRNLATQNLRLNEARIRTVYGPSPAAETLVIDQRTGQPYHLPKVPAFVALGHGPDAWVLDDMLGRAWGPPLPPTPPPLPLMPPADPQPAARPRGYRGGRRAVEERRVSPWVTLAVGVVVGTALWWAALTLAAGWVIR